MTTSFVEDRRAPRTDALVAGDTTVGSGDASCQPRPPGVDGPGDRRELRPARSGNGTADGTTRWLTRRMVSPLPEPDPLIDPDQPVPDDPGELLPDAPEPLPPPPIEPTPDDPGGDPGGVPEPA
jgi:hypothetical protein